MDTAVRVAGVPSQLKTRILTGVALVLAGIVCVPGLALTSDKVAEVDTGRTYTALSQCEDQGDSEGDGVAVAGGRVVPSAAENADAAPGPTRTIRFPSDRSMGTLAIRTRPSPRRYRLAAMHNALSEWRYLADARGDVAVPADAYVRLEVARAAIGDLSPLDEMEAGDLQAVIVSCPQGVDADADVMPYLGGLAGLKELRLYSPKTSDRGARHLANLRELEYLWLFSECLGDAGIAHLNGLTALEALALRSRISERGIRHLAGLTALRELSLVIDGIEGPGLTALASLPSLEFLELRGRGFSDNGLRYLKVLAGLRSLVLRGNDFGITDRGLLHVARLAGLEELRLTRMESITDAGLCHLASLRRLKLLDLGHARVTDAGLSRLTALQSLEDLTLPAEGVTDLGLAHVAKLDKLRRLDAGGRRPRDLAIRGPFTDKGLRHLSQLKKLEQLTIGSGTGITDEGVDCIAQLPRLEWLRLGANGVTDAGMAKLAAVTTLTGLDLGCRGVTIAGVNRLNALPELKWLYVNSLARHDAALDLSDLTELEELVLTFQDGNGREGMNALRDEDLACLADHTRLRRLHVGFSAMLTDAGMAHLARLNKLERVVIGGQGVTDAGLRYLSGKQAMKSLRISGDFTREGLYELGNLKALNDLSIDSVNDPGTTALARLHGDLPSLCLFNDAPCQCHGQWPGLGWAMDRRPARNRECVRRRTAMTGITAFLTGARERPLEIMFLALVCGLCVPAIAFNARRPVMIRGFGRGGEKNPLHEEGSRVAEGPAAEDAPAASAHTRTIRFPSERSVGTLSVRVRHDPKPYRMTFGYGGLRHPWEFLAEARGTVAVPEGGQVRLELGRTALHDASPLAELGPNDLCALHVYCPKGMRVNIDETVMHHLSRLTGLRFLDVFTDNLTERGVRHIGGLRGLEELWLRSKQIGDTSLVHLEGLHSLEALRVYGCVTDRGLRRIAGLTSLHELSLWSDAIRGEGLAFLGLLPSLRLLEFSSGGLSNDGLRHLGELPFLRHLRFFNEGMSVTDSDLSHLSHLKDLEGIELVRMDQITDAGMVHLKSLQNLKLLDLFYTRVTDAGLAELTGLQALEALKLPREGMSDRSLAQISELPHLRRLDAQGSSPSPEKGRGSFTDEGLRHLSRLESLEELQMLAGVGVTDAGMAHIARLPQLKQLRLLVRAVTNDGLAALASTKSLRSLDLNSYSSDITVAGVNHLNALENLEFLRVSNAIQDGATLDLSGLANLEELMLRVVDRFGRHSKGALRDEDLACLQNLTTLTSVQVGTSPGFGDAGMAHLAKLKKLERVVIGGERVTDAGLRYVADKRGLTYLHIKGDFSDEGLHELEGLNNLTHLTVDNKEDLSMTAAARLQAALPRLWRLNGAPCQ